MGCVKSADIRPFVNKYWVDITKTSAGQEKKHLCPFYENLMLEYHDKINKLKERLQEAHRLEENLREEKKELQEENKLFLEMADSTKDRTKILNELRATEKMDDLKVENDQLKQTIELMKNQIIQTHSKRYFKVSFI